MDLIICVMRGFPIRKSAGRRIFAPNRSLSQLVTSFVGSQCQGILLVLFLAWPLCLNLLELFEIVRLSFLRMIPIIIFHIRISFLIQLALAVYYFLFSFQSTKENPQDFLLHQAVACCKSPLWAYILIWTYIKSLLQLDCQNKHCLDSNHFYNKLYRSGP